MKNKHDIITLFLISFLGLYLEMLVIRWLSANVRIMAYYTNIVLITSFLGLSIGSLRSRMKVNLFYFFPFFIFVLIFTAIKLGSYHILKPESAEEFWSSLVVQSSSLPLYYVLLILVFLTIITFIPLGQKTGMLLNRLPPIQGYSINIIGSLIGIFTFALISFLQISPPFWFAIAFLSAVPFLLKKKIQLIVGLIFFGISLFYLQQADEGNLWSPYYRITLEKKDISVAEKRSVAYQINVNTDLHQYILDLRDDAPMDNFLTRSKSFYEAPYRLAAHKNVCIIGAGSGNDVAGALRMNAQNIDAVEIDPLIVSLGRQYHPEKPYDNKRVTIHVDDARSFLKKSDKKFDLIVFGFLDSQRLFSHMSNLRLDSYIYTVECFQDVKKRLNQNGVCAVSFAVTKNWIFSRFYLMLREVFHAEPLVFENEGAFMFVVKAQGDLPLTPLEGLNLLDPAAIPQLLHPVPLAYDDWPFLYLEKKELPLDYAQMLVTLFLIATVFVLLFKPKGINEVGGIYASTDGPSGLFHYAHFFFLGAAFMLLETKSITELSLQFGSTWLVTTVVIAAILLMILLANVLVSRTEIHRYTGVYLFLFASILLCLVVPRDFFLTLPPFIKTTATPLFLTLPLFFAGIIFIISFKKTKNRDIAFGANILGAVIGGLLEYSALPFGLKSLYYFSLVFYFFSFLCICKPLFQKNALTESLKKIYIDSEHENETLS